jgi:hypothetical protein
MLSDIHQQLSVSKILHSVAVAGHFFDSLFREGSKISFTQYKEVANLRLIIKYCRGFSLL